MPLRHGVLLVALALALTACATPQIQRIGPSMASPQLLPDQVRTADAARLPLSAWLPAGEPRAVILGLHGFNDYRRAFEETGEFLASRGFAVYAYDQRGFGETAHAGRWFGAKQMATDLCTVAGLLRQRHPGLPLYVIAESMGGAVALVAQEGTTQGSAVSPAGSGGPGIPEIVSGAHCPLRVDGLVLVAPAVWGRSTMPALQRGALWLAAHTFPALTLSPRGLDITPTDNEAARRKLREDPLVIKKTRVDTLWGLSQLMERALAVAPAPELPTLILYGERDEIIPKQPICRWLSGLPGSPLHRLAVYQNGWHMLTRDLQANAVLSDIAVWLADRYASLPSGSVVPGKRPAFCVKVN